MQHLRANHLGGFVLASQNVPVEAGQSYNFRFWARTEGLVRENRDDPKAGYAAFQVWVFWLTDETHGVPGDQGHLWVMNQQTDFLDWTQAINHTVHHGANQPPYLAPAGAKYAAIRFQLATMTPGGAPRAWVDEVQFWDSSLEGPPPETTRLLVDLPNPGFEGGRGRAPSGWHPVGSGMSRWVLDESHTGRRCVAVSDAGLGPFSGWATELPARAWSSYRLSGWIKGGELTANSAIGGGALCLEFLGAEGQVLGPEVLSPAVPGRSAWIRVETASAEAPAGTTKLRLIAGLRYCGGTAWFDDLVLTEERTIARVVPLVTRDPEPDAAVRYAVNLLHHGTIEAGAGDQPTGWTYVGSSAKDWSTEQIEAFHRVGRPVFGIGRGRGEWSHKLTYAGHGALLNISLDPPLSHKLQWYGRTPVDAAWLSDPMPCEAGQGYLAGGWVRPGVRLSSCWYGPLELRFYDAQGKQVPAANNSVRPGLNDLPAGVWSYWATLPYLAPDGAVMMRLRFGQELSASEGGWGRTYADNLAVWQAPAPVSAEKIKEFYLQPAAFRRWFAQFHAKLKPPYLASPPAAPEYESTWGRVLNSAPGNLFDDPAATVKLQVDIDNLLGEARRVTLGFERFDQVGNLDATIDVPSLSLHGDSPGRAELVLPPTKRYGTFYLGGTVLEGEATVGRVTGRYAVLPPPTRSRTADNIWGVTLLAPIHGDDRPHEQELGEVLREAGFGLGWVRADRCEGADLDRAWQESRFFAKYGLQTVLQLSGPQVSRPLDLDGLRELGRRVARRFKGKVVAYGCWGIEQSNNRTKDKPAYRPILDGEMLTDEEYDQVYVAVHDGLCEVDPDTPILIGNIATDWKAATVRRMSGEPVNGRFDGAILNAYLGLKKTIRGNLAELDQHGGTTKTVWQEECADQRSPSEGQARRRGEVEGAYNLVRTWLTVKGLGGPRVRSMTIWGFVANTVGSDIAMVTQDLQPRPQYGAHLVMADQTADAEFVADRSTGKLTCYEWRRGDGPLFTVWTSGGEQELTLTAPAGLMVTDCFGNRQVVPAVDGKATVKVTPAPVYVAGDGVQVILAP